MRAQKVKTTTEELRMKLFGGLQITLGGSRLTDFTYRKSPALLAYLATTGRPHTREFLIGLFWGESSEKRARASLRTVLWDLRRQLAPFLVIDYQKISFNLKAPHRLDVAEFQKHLNTIPSPFPTRPRLIETDGGTKLTTDTQADALQKAVSLYQDEFLAGFYISDAPAFESWMLEQREQARRSTLQALHLLIAYYVTHDMYFAGIDAATRLLALDPWQEETHRRLMHLLALSGQHSAYHLELLARYSDNLHGLQPNTALIELQRVWEDIEKAWIWAATQCNVPKLDRAIDGLARFLILKGLFQKGEKLFGIAGDYLQENCRASESLDSLKTLSRLRLERARYLNKLGHYAQADGIAQTMIELAHSHQWTALEAAAHREGQLPQAIQFYKKALSLHRSLGQPSLAMEPLVGLVGAFLAADDLASALNCVEEILPQLKAKAPIGTH